MAFPHRHFLDITSIIVSVLHDAQHTEHVSPGSLYLGMAFPHRHFLDITLTIVSVLHDAQHTAHVSPGSL